MRYLIQKTTFTKLFSKSVSFLYSMMAFGFLFIVVGLPSSFAQTFSELEGTGLPGVFQSSAAWGDYDNDGDLDILLTGRSGSGRMSTIYTNDGDGTFTELEGVGLPGVSSSSAAWGDYDNDGDLDILLTGYTGSGRMSAIYTNDGDGTFTELEEVALPGVSSSSATWGDYDNDGDLDILLAGYTGSGNISTIYTNDGDGTFTELTGAGLTDITAAKVAWGDYDNDSDLDILLTGDTGSGRISTIYTNDGGGNFSELKGAGLTGVSGSAAWGDYDNDGDLDILMAGTPGHGRISKIYTNDGDGTFTELEGAGLTGVSESSADWGDYDNDGDLDILLTGNLVPGLISTIYTNTIYTNNASTANTVPQEPTNLTAIPNNDEGSVAFNWDAATDAETPSAGLSYNVFIKENPAGTPEYIKSPMAQENDGWRKLPELGNAMQNTRYTWNIPKEYCGSNADFTYKVQAIDHAYAGSEFSSETGFSIDLTNTPSTLYVDANATGGNDGSDWTNAFTHLQDALNHACFAGEVWVAQGTYKPGTDETDSFDIPEGVTLLGGFDGTETTADERNWSEHPTILSGDLDESGDASAGDHFQVVRIVNNSVTIDGLIIENGYNNDTRYAAGIYNKGDNTIIKNSIIRDNTVEGNNENGIGGGFVNESGDTEFVNCLFYNNTAWNYGGALSIEGNTVTLTNCTITNNDAEERGGAIHFYNGSLNATNTIFANNTAPANGNINDDGGSGTGTLNYSLVYNGDVSSAINQTNPITGDPLFADPENGDYSLANTSPALNAGDNSAIPSGVVSDLAGNARIYEGTPNPDVVDVGTYEYQGEKAEPISPDGDNILYVDKYVSAGNQSGNSWSNAIPELADALKWAREQYDAETTDWDSEDPLQIWVAEGTYNPLYNAADGSYDTDGGRDNAFVMVPDVQLYGGFDPDNEITDVDDDRLFPTTNPGEGTILSGDINGDDNPDNFDNHTENTHHVVVSSGNVGIALLNGFSITGGNADGAFSSISVNGNDILRNRGGGMYNWKSQPTISDSKINGNTAVFGGGVFNFDTSSNFTNIFLSGNAAEIGGAGIKTVHTSTFSGPETTYTNCLFVNNAAVRRGGAISFDDDDSNGPIFTNCSFAGNTAEEGSLLYYFEDGSDTSPQFNNSILSSSDGSNLIYVDNSTIDNIIFRNNLTNVASLGNHASSSDNILDADAGFSDSSLSDYTLLATSPAINAGAPDTNLTLFSGGPDNPTDLAGNPRVFGGETGVIDMGAYEFQGESVTAPGPVVLSAPADEAANVGLTPEFSWQAVDDADEYQVQVSGDDEFGSTVIDESELEETTFEPTGDLDNSATYYWRVRASNGTGDGEWSEIFSFTTLPESSAVVILTDPSDDSEDAPLQPLFEWNPADGADSYDLVVSPNGDLSDPVIDEDEIDNTQFQTTDDLDFSTTYHWRVRGVNSGGPGQWSDVFSFTTQARPEAADNRIFLANTDSYTFIPTDVGTDDNSFTIIIDELPGGFNGQLQVDGNDVETDDEISVGDINDGKLIYMPPADIYGYGFDSFEFSLKDADDNISDDSYTMSLDVAATSVSLDYEGEGWRFLSSPGDGEIIGDFFGPIWTQGFPGADSPGATFANIQTMNQDEYQWEPVDHADNALDAGDAVIAYVYGDDDNNGSDDGFPKTLTSSTDDWMDLDGAYDETLAYDSEQQDTGDSFTLWGNPYPIAVDLCEAELTNIAGNAYLWDPSAGGGNGDYVTLSCAADDVEIAPFQSVWLRVTDNSNTLEIPAEAYMDGTTDGYFKQNQSEGQFLITMNMKTEDPQEEVFSTSTRILFDEEASAGSDLMDAPKLSSEGLASQYLSLYSMDEDNNPYALQALPMDMYKKLSIPLDITTTESGQFTLDWTLPESHVFSGSYFLRDNQSGEVMELREGLEYSFKITGEKVIQTKETESTHPMSEISGTGVSPLNAHRMNSVETPRFELLVAASGVDGMTELGAVPDNFTLAQNYPNPFNPTTVIRYQLPVSSEVRLEVYDMLGRNVATLVNEQVAAGRHAVNFDASNLSSGVYLYRLQAGSQIMTKKLTILK